MYVAAICRATRVPAAVVALVREVDMYRSLLRLLPRVGSLVVGAMLGLGSMAVLAQTAPAADELPALSQMYFDVGNPSAGDSIHVGRFMIEGIAFDRAADEGPGIERIDVFLNDRDTGGTLIGHGVLGAPNPVPDDPALAGSGWTAQVTLTSKMTGPNTLFFYALSGVTGEEMVVTIPVQVMQ
jgi:hypothetical protein